MVSVKICGLKDEAMVEAAIAAGADRVGFVVAPTSPRHVDLERAAELSAYAASRDAQPWVVTAGLTETQLWGMREWPVGDLVVQLHGRETPESVTEARDILIDRTVVKALPVAKRADLQAANAYDAAHMLLLDAKPPKGATRGGGHGAPFNWSILRGWTAPKPWVLSGGLTPENVHKAIQKTGADAVDVSSGVESAPGEKDIAKIQAFIQAVKKAEAAL